jgi:hypothetical protein
MVPLLLLAGNYPTPIAPAASTYGGNIEEIINRWLKKL